eukprot:gene1846-33265_t
MAQLVRQKSRTQLPKELLGVNIAAAANELWDVNIAATTIVIEEVATALPKGWCSSSDKKSDERKNIKTRKKKEKKGCMGPSYLLYALQELWDVNIAATTIVIEEVATALPKGWCSSSDKKSDERKNIKTRKKKEKKGYMGPSYLLYALQELWDVNIAATANLREEVASALTKRWYSSSDKKSELWDVNIAATTIVIEEVATALPKGWCSSSDKKSELWDVNIAATANLREEVASALTKRWYSSSDKKSGAQLSEVISLIYSEPKIGGSYKLPYYDFFSLELEPLIKTLLGKDGLKYISRMAMEKLDHGIPLHRDPGTLPGKTHRIYVPITECSTQLESQLCPQPDKLSMGQSVILLEKEMKSSDCIRIPERVGVAYELNNRILHRIEGESVETGCVLLVIDAKDPKYKPALPLDPEDKPTLPLWPFYCYLSVSTVADSQEDDRRECSRHFPSVVAATNRNFSRISKFSKYAFPINTPKPIAEPSAEPRNWSEKSRRRGCPTAQASISDVASSDNDSGVASSGIIIATGDEDTIASIVTDAIEIASNVFRQGGKFRFNWKPESHRVYYGTAVDADERVIDEVLLLSMLSPRSYTCEDVIELHCHGGGVCARRVLQSCYEAGARPARPGEFTLRAFLNGRLDLTQAESVMELVNARTPAAADSALAGLQGGVGEAVASIRNSCVDLCAQLEARLDFDEDLPAMDQQGLKDSVERLQAQVEQTLRTAKQGSLLRQGLQIAIVGRPNVGKSSLLNAWTQTNRAIVTDIAGTTRDVLEADLIGLAATGADIVFMVIDAKEGWTSKDQEIFSAMWGAGPTSSSCSVKGLAMLVANKTDLADSDAASTSDSEGASGGADQPSIFASGAPKLLLPLIAKDAFRSVIYTSAKTRRGLKDLEAALLELAGAPQLAAGGISWSINDRQADALVRSHEALSRVTDSIQQSLPIDFWTIDMREAIIALGEVSGDEVTEQAHGLGRVWAPAKAGDSIMGKTMGKAVSEDPITVEER